ncbi:MAG: TonB-dependent receptor, partial [Caulobacteraceae bacterium]|nr:TonB-dependent receptor [Caulobacteraceae bacterium]
PAPQQTPAPTPPEEQEDEGLPRGTASSDAYDLGTVTVTGVKPRGSVQGDIPPDVTLSAEEIKAYGASNIAELLQRLEPLTTSSRGRSNSGPVLLLNGRRISGFQEIQGIPVEAIERTEILPEEVALTYGYSADQRVVNFVLKQQFRQASVNLQGRGPTQGGRTTAEVDGNYFTIKTGDRWNFDIEQQHDTALFESERDIVRPVPANTYGPTGAPATSEDLSAYRTLQSRGDRTTIRGSLSHDLDSTTKATGSFSLEDSSTNGYGGLPTLSLTLPGTNPFSPTGTTTQITRYVDDPGAMLRDNDSLTAKGALLVDGYLKEWRYSVTASYDRTETDTTTGRGYEDALVRAVLQAPITANDPTVNPFGAVPTAALTRRTDTAHSVSTGGNLESVLNGKVWEGPAGNLQSTVKFGLDTRTLDSESDRSGLHTESSLQRDRVYGSVNFSLPLTSTRREFLQKFGDLSLNFNAGYDDLSDFGGLTSVGGGVNWAPNSKVGFVVSYTDEQGAPTINQVNDPVIATPNVPVYDFNTGQTVNITQITGGNRNLGADERQVIKAGFNLTPFQSLNFNFSSNYTWSRTDDAISTFPTITPQLEAALPGRFVRDPITGQLLSIDARPLNYAKTEKADLRTGFNFSRPFGKPNPAAAGRQGMMMMGGGPRPGGGGGAGGPPPGGGGMQMRMGGGGGGRGGAGMQPGQGMFNFSIYHTWRFQDEILIADGLPVIDQLNGGATGSRGGTPKQEVQIQGGAFRNGFGAFVNANWREGTHVDGGSTGSDLDFSGQTTVGVNLFVDMNQRPEWVKKAPWLLTGARISLGFDNIFDSRTEVTTSATQLPVNYQPDYLDPTGRVIRLSYRKVLF